MRDVTGTTSRRLRAVGAIAALALVAACGGGSSSGGKPVGGGKGHPKPKPSVVVITKTTHTVPIGQTVQIGTAGQGVAALMKMGKPDVSRNRLSKTYGYPPARGYYVTFPVKILNDGKSSLVIDRLDFYVVIPGHGKTNNNGGNAPYSGAKLQLDTTPLATGESVSNVLTFDVSVPHGKFVYGPGGKVSVAWKF